MKRFLLLLIPLGVFGQNHITLDFEYFAISHQENYFSEVIIVVNPDYDVFDSQHGEYYFSLKEEPKFDEEYYFLSDGNMISSRKYLNESKILSTENLPKYELTDLKNNVIGKTFRTLNYEGKSAFLTLNIEDRYVHVREHSKNYIDSVDYRYSTADKDFNGHYIWEVQEELNYFYFYLSNEDKFSCLIFSDDRENLLGMLYFGHNGIVVRYNNHYLYDPLLPAFQSLIADSQLYQSYREVQR